MILKRNHICAEYKMILDKWSIEYIIPYGCFEYEDFCKKYAKNNVILEEILNDFNHSQYVLNKDCSDEGLVIKIAGQYTQEQKIENVFKIVFNEFQAISLRKKEKIKNDEFQILCKLFCSQSYIEKEFHKFCVLNNRDHYDYFDDKGKINEFKHHLIEDFVKIELSQIDTKYHDGMKRKLIKEIDIFIDKTLHSSC